MSTRVIHINDVRDHPERYADAVYIGRAAPRRGLRRSIWANPYRIGDRISYGHAGKGEPIMTREGLLFSYTNDILEGGNHHLLGVLPELRGRPLACWCRHDGVPMTNGINGPDNRCHGDQLVHWLATFTDDELRVMGDGATTQDILEARTS